MGRRVRGLICLASGMALAIAGMILVIGGHDRLAAACVFVSAVLTAIAFKEAAHG